MDTQNFTGWTALMSAGEIGHTDVVRLLLEARAAVDLKDNKGWTAMMCAGANGHVGALRLLLRAGAAVEATSKNGETVLGEAVRSGELEAARIILEAGAELPPSKWLKFQNAEMKRLLALHRDVRQARAAEAARVGREATVAAARLAAAQREADAEEAEESRRFKEKQKSEKLRRVEAEKSERCKHEAMQKEAEKSRRLEEKMVERKRKALEQDTAAERVRVEAASELHEAAAGHDEETLRRCLAAAQRIGVAEPDIAAAKVQLKQLSGVREAAIAAAREGEATLAAAAELRSLLDDPTATRSGLKSALRRAEAGDVGREVGGGLLVRAREQLGAKAQASQGAREEAEAAAVLLAEEHLALAAVQARAAREAAAAAVNARLAEEEAEKSSAAIQVRAAREAAAAASVDARLAEEEAEKSTAEPRQGKTKRNKQRPKTQHAEAMPGPVQPGGTRSGPARSAAGPPSQCSDSQATASAGAEERQRTATEKGSTGTLRVGKGGVSARQASDGVGEQGGAAVRDAGLNPKTQRQKTRRAEAVSGPAQAGGAFSEPALSGADPPSQCSDSHAAGAVSSGVKEGQRDASEHGPEGASRVGGVLACAAQPSSQASNGADEPGEAEAGE